MARRSTALGATPGTIRFDNLAAWLSWQEGLHVREIELGLRRCRNVARKLGLRSPDCTVVSVAGTNGKGSSVAMLAGILKASGYRVATYTSPHLVKYNERIRINGEMAGDDQLCEAFQRIDNARGRTSLTYFEFGTLAALDLFQHAVIDIAILEVGLGGRLDAVNLIDADIALITAIGVDHVNWLGPDRETIAKEKAGIYRPGTPAVCSDPDAPQSLQTVATDLGTPLYLLGRDFRYTDSGDGAWSWFSDKADYSELPWPSLIGEFQLQNAAGVLMVLQLLQDRFPVDMRAVKSGLRQLDVPGRVQIVRGPVQYVLDVAHNPHAAKALVKTLQERPVTGRTEVVVGMLKDKDCQGVFAALKQIVDGWHLVSLKGPRGASAELLVSELEKLGGNAPMATYESIETALRGVQSTVMPGDRVLVVGSFLTVAGVLPELTSRVGD